MIQIARGDADTADVETAFAKVVELNAGAEALQIDREILIGHLSGERPLEVSPEAARGVDVPLGAGYEERSEEGEPLNMVPVGVADEEVAVHRAVGSRHELATKLIRTGAAVDDNPRSVVGHGLDARRVSAVADRRRARAGNRPACTPKGDPHTLSPNRTT